METTTNTQAPDTYVIACNKTGTVFFQDERPSAKHGISATGTQFLSEACHFFNLFEAQAQAARLRCYNYLAEVYTVRGEVTLSSEAKAKVAARRAARNAERKF